MKYISPGCSVNSSISSGRLVTENCELGLAHRTARRRFALLDIGTDGARRDFLLGIGIDRHPIWRVGQVARLFFAAPVEDITAIEALEGFEIFLQHHVMDGEGAGEPRYAAQLRVAQTG